MKNIFNKMFSFALAVLITNTTMAQDEKVEVAIGSGEAVQEPKTEDINPGFTPPQIITIIRPFNHGLAPSDSITKPIDYIIDRGQDANINTGDTLNVYRKEIVNRGLDLRMRIYVGTMEIIDSQEKTCIGEFTSNENIEIATILHKTAMIDDYVVPRLVLSASVLFASGQASLNPGTAAEFDRIAKFVENFSPTKILLVGHTDSDGDADSNLRLSEDRAKAVKNYLTESYDFITSEMIQARGHGEAYPIAPNNSPENKTLNRRIEVVIWE